MSLKETLKEALGWYSPIGVGFFFIASGILFYLVTLAIQNILNI